MLGLSFPQLAVRAIRARAAFAAAAVGPGVLAGK